MKRVSVRSRVWCCLAWVVAAVAGSAVPASTRAGVPGFDAVRAAYQPSDRVLLDRHGEPIQSLRVDTMVRRGPWLALAELSPALRQAIVVGEDRRFWDHGGVDWRALAGVAWANAWNQRTRGASTLTMQLAALLDPGLRRGADGRSLAQKFDQIAAARALEARWTKAQILETYLNLVPLRGEQVGVAAASGAMFGKHASGLDAVEAAIIAALVRAPNADARAVQRRACALLEAMASAECAAVPATLAAALARRGDPGEAAARAPQLAPQLVPQIAPHFGRYWLAAGGGERTTIDASLQRLALAALRRQIAELKGREVDDGAVVVIHNASGELRAWVGSAGGAAGVDAVLARRQPGSTIKPFVYALAFERRLVAAQSWIADEPLELASGADAFRPRNFDQHWRGWVRAREALASSLNVPAVRVAAMVGPDALFERLDRNGLRLRESSGFHGHALALGSAEVTLLDLANAYRTLANGGRWRPLAMPRRPDAAGVAERRVYRAEVAREIGAILADNAARAAGFGFDSPLVTRRRAAVKTGTSKDMRDNWCIGFSAGYTVGVWVGNVSGAPMHGVSGVVGAAPVWRQIVEALAADGSPPATPADQHERVPARAARPGLSSDLPWQIRTPAEGAVLAFDPDIPPPAQRLRLAGPRGHWSVDGRPLGRGQSFDWPLAPGRHVVEVHDDQRQLIDRVRFEVRPGVRPAPPPRSERRQPALPPNNRSTAASMTRPIAL